ncbi:MAG: response regulator [Tannerellaceae bacterium]|nr:response regulator [Tannerellaceae bacterium]
MKYLILSIWIFFLSLLIQPVHGEAFIFDRLSTGQGFSSSRITTILQDQTGYIWVGTSEGLNRYDGYHIRTFHPEAGNSHSIQSNAIHKLHEDENGYLWISFSSGGISYYDPVREQFFNYSREWLQQLRVYGEILCFSSGRPGETWIGTENGLLIFDSFSGQLRRMEDQHSAVAMSAVYSIYTDPEGTLWLGTLSGFSRYNTGTKQFEDYTLHVLLEDGNTENVLNGVHTIYKDKKGFLWIGTGKSGAYCSIHPEAPWFFRPAGYRDTRVYQIMESQAGDIWIGHNKGVSVVEKEMRNALRSRHYLSTPEELAPTGERVIKYMQEDLNGNIWFVDGRYNQGMLYYSAANQSMNHLNHLPEDPYSIASNQISCMYIDRYANLWIGHTNYGISRCDLRPPVFHYRFGHTTEDSLQLSSNHILAILEDRETNLWVATVKGLDRINPDGKIDKRFTFSPRSSSSSLSGQFISTLVEDEDGYLWIGYQDAHPERLDLSTFQIRPFYLSNHPEYQDFLKVTSGITKDKEGNVWITTYNMGLIQYNRKTRNTYYYTQPSPFSSLPDLSSVPLFSHCVDAEGFVWIGMEGRGIRSFDPSTESYTNYFRIGTDEHSILSDNIHTLYCDSKGTLWIGTNNGLSGYDKRKDFFTHYTISDGLAGNVIRSIEEASPGLLVVGTNRGISMMDLSSGKIVNYSTQNRLLTDECMPGAMIRRASGEIVVGTDKGLMSFHPDSLLNPDVSDILSLHISGIYVGEEKLHTSSVRLPYQSSRDLRIDFFAFNYAFPSANQYRYRLSGYDKEWKTAETGHPSAHYNQLPPGKYVFRVEVGKSDQSWRHALSFPVVILTPWWRTGWFLMLIAILTFLLLYILYKNRFRIYEMRQAELEKKVQERTLLLREAKSALEVKNRELESLNDKLKTMDEQKTTFFTTISHELRTPLTIIKGLTENLKEEEIALDAKRWKDAVSVIQRNVLRLIRHVNELLDISLMEKGELYPHVSYTDLGGFLQETGQSFGPIAEKYAIQFTWQVSPEIQYAFFDKDILEQALFNVISNALKYTPDGGSVSFQANYVYEAIQNEKENWLEIRICDTGIGISPDHISHIFDRYYKIAGRSFQRFESSGIGLAHTKEILNSHLGRITCQSEEGKGTLFTICLPVFRHAFPDEWIHRGARVSTDRDLYNKILIAPEESVDPVGTPGKQTLLLVEDNEDLIHYLRDAFQSEYTIFQAFNGKEGFRRAVEVHPDVIISDIVMPVMDGLSLCEKLKSDERTSHIPVILLTARIEEKHQLEGYDSGADDYLLKPFNIHVLKAKIRNLLSWRDKVVRYFKESFRLDQPEANVPEMDKAFIKKATQVVLDHLQDPSFDVDRFCREMAMSRANLFRKLKAAIGLSASAFTRNIRIKQAALLLESGAYTINEIATLTGFSDPNYFSRCFKEIYGVTPSTYMRTGRK